MLSPTQRLILLHLVLARTLALPSSSSAPFDEEHTLSTFSFFHFCRNIELAFHAFLTTFQTYGRWNPDS